MVPGNLNLNIYTFLLQLEDWKKQNKEEEPKRDKALEDDKEDKE